LCRAKKLKIATAESCTGGLVAATLTEIAGSSDVVERGFVTYSNEAKHEMLGGPLTTLERPGPLRPQPPPPTPTPPPPHPPPARLCGTAHRGCAPGRGGAEQAGRARAFRRRRAQREADPA